MPAWLATVLFLAFLGPAAASGRTGPRTEDNSRTVGDPAVNPIDVGTRSQVFIDRMLVRLADGVTFKQHPARKHPARPWLSHRKDRPGPAGPMVIYDEEQRIFRSWSTGSYNTSKDGFTWSRPEANNDTWRYIVRASVISDQNDPDPARRYKLMTFGPSRDFPPGLNDADKVKNPDGSETLFWYCKGYNAYISRDGRTLTHLSSKPIVTTPEGKSPGDMVNAYYDRRHERFVAFLKMSSRETKFTRRRCFAVRTSKDFEAWSKPSLAFVPDELDDAGGSARLEKVRPLLLTPIKPERVATHVYGVGGPIQLESCVVVLLRVFTTHHKGDGPSEIQLAVSRDLQHWGRPFRAPVIPRGRVASDHQTSDWDSCWFNNEGPGIEVGDEVWVYYSARNTPHDHPVGFGKSSFPPAVQAEARKHVGTKYRSGIGIAVWTRDRFVAAEDDAAGGILTTVPITFSGNRLELNAVTRPGGNIIVEILDAAGKLLTRSKPFAGDDLRHRARWKSPTDLASLAGKPVSLRFRISIRASGDSYM